MMQAEAVTGAQACALEDRGVVEVSGDTAASFLQGLITNDVPGLAPGTACYAALLTPQGKILFDFLVAAHTGETGKRYFLDCPRALAGDLAKRLAFYRLRAKIEVADRSQAMGVAAAWGEPAGFGRPAPEIRLVYADPRRAELGSRAVLAREALASLPADPAAYERHRIAIEIPKGGLDFAYGETFPHEANLDRLHGVDFKKGCYVGQEVVSRVEHRGLARKRIVGVRFEGPPPPPGSEITAGDVVLGTMGSSIDGRGLAMLRLDRVEAALAAGAAIMSAGETRLTLASAVA